MNERERAFFARLSEQRLTPNQARMLFGLLGGKTIRKCGLPETSRERTVTELRKLGFLEKVDGRWRLSGDIAGIFDSAPVVAGRSQSADPPPTQQASPAGQVSTAAGAPPTPQSTPFGGDATVTGKYVHEFLQRPGAEIVPVLALLELTGTDYQVCRQIEDLALNGGETPAELIPHLDRAETQAKRRYPKSS